MRDAIICRRPKTSERDVRDRERAVNIFAIFATFGRSPPSSNVPICALIDESASMEFATLLVWKIDLYRKRNDVFLKQL